MRSLLACLLLLTIQSAAPAQDQPDARLDRRDRTEQMGGQLLDTFRGLGDWRQHYGYMMDAVDSIYEANQWNSEPDQFSRELIHTVEALEPWDFQGRLDTMVGMFSDRYLLDEEQEEKLRAVFMEQMAGLLRDHGPRIMEYAGEIVKTRAAGEPFTPELVARWTKMSQPVYEDMKKRMNRMAGEFMNEVGPQQRAMIEADLGAANNRLKRVDELNEQWRRGEWSPADWGMQHDPIQLAGEQRAAAAGGGASSGTAGGGRKPVTPPDGPALAADGGIGATAEAGTLPPDPKELGESGAAAPGVPNRSEPGAKSGGPSAEDAWALYVREFIRRYQLDADQVQRAWIIYRDVRTRASELGIKLVGSPQTDAVGPALAKDSRAGKPAAAVDGAISPAGQRLFEQMKRRLDRLPTRAQRRATADKP